MEAILARDGLVSSGLVLHQAGHPGYRQPLRMPMAMPLHQKAREQQERVPGAVLGRLRKNAEKIWEHHPVMIWRRNFGASYHPFYIILLDVL